MTKTTGLNVLVAMPLGEFGGGAEQMLINYLAYRNQDSSVHLHILFFSSGKLADSVQDLGYPTRVIHAGRIREIGRLMGIQRKVSQLIEEWQINCVLAWMPKACAYVALPARLGRKPLFIWRHDIPTSLDRLDRLVLRYGRPVSVACSSEIANRALQRFGFKGFSLQAIHPGVAPVPFDGNAVNVIRDMVLGGREGVIIGTVARLQPWKRVDLFLKAMADLKGRVPNVKTLVVGGESHGLSKGHADELKRLGKQLLGDDVIFAGEQRNVGDWLQAMDVFVLPSDAEPFGIALVEALIAGKPIVACAGGGPEEIVCNDSLGILLPATPNPQDMAVAIEKLLDPAVRSKARTVNPMSAARFAPELMASRIDQWLATAP